MSRRILIVSLVALGLALPQHRAGAQLATSTHASCVGGAIGCSQIDFFIEFLGLTEPTIIDAFTLSLGNPSYRFAAPGTTEAEDALGFNFYNPSIGPSGLTLAGVFDFGAFLDPTITATLRIRAEMFSTPAGSTDAVDMGYAYTVAAGGETVSAGAYTPEPLTAVPEPGTLTMLATGLFGVGGWAMRRRARPRAALDRKMTTVEQVATA